MKFTILHQNIAGICSKKDILELTLKYLHEKEHTGIDVLCLTETFVKASDCNSYNVFGFKLASFYGRKKSRGDVCILIKEDIEWNEIKFVSDLAESEHFECCGIEIPLHNMHL